MSRFHVNSIFQPIFNGDSVIGLLEAFTQYVQGTVSLIHIHQVDDPISTA